MDKASSIIVLGIVILIALPFIIHKAYKKMRKRKFLKDFIDMSKKAKLSFSHKELLYNTYAIGIDPDSKKLLYFNKQDKREEGTLIDLSEVEKCRIVTIDRHLNNQNGNNDKTNRIELIFSYSNHSTPEKILELYMNTEFMPNTDDIAHAENWLRIINSNLKTGRK